MPRRDINFVTGNFYHLYNRSVEKKNIFNTETDYYRFMVYLAFYKMHKGPLSRLYSLKKPDVILPDILNNVSEAIAKGGLDEKVSIATFVVMPNHFHLIVRQDRNDGIKTFMKQLQQAYSQYYNTRYERVGPLWQNRFKSKAIQTLDYLRYLSKYVHINPTNSSRIDNVTLNNLKNYPFSSFPEYLGIRDYKISKPELILNKDLDIAKYLQYLKSEDDDELIDEVEKYIKIEK